MDDAFNANALKLRPEQLKRLRSVETGVAKPKRRKREFIQITREQSERLDKASHAAEIVLEVAGPDHLSGQRCSLREGRQPVCEVSSTSQFEEARSRKTEKASPKIAGGYRSVSLSLLRWAHIRSPLSLLSVLVYLLY
jgi:hypothetical protein